MGKYTTELENSKSLNTILSDRKLGMILASLQLVMALIFVGLVTSLNVVPAKYLIPAIIILTIFETFTLYTQLSVRCNKIGKFFALFLCIILGLGCNYLFKAQTTLEDISGANMKIYDISIIVLKDDPAKSIDDAKSYLFGIQEVNDRADISKVIQIINNELSTEIDAVTFQNFDSQVEALYNGEVGAIILGEAYREMILDVHEDFNEKTRVIFIHQIEKEVETKISDKKVTLDPFTIYISGIDTYGSISKTSRSDVNIIVNINPNTKQILLTTTPRDYYVPLIPVSNGQEDKLTHAGIYGIDVLIATLEELYDIDIDYYIRINFTTLVGMVDVLGDITVNSKYAFNAGGYSFQKGDNKLNGEEALAFSRERYSFAAGDNQRGINQMEVIKGMISKAVSSAIITNFNSITSNISGSLETNMSLNEIKRLVKMQMNNMSEWNIEFNNVTGQGSRRVTYSYGSRPLYVMIPDNSSVLDAKEKMRYVLR